MPLELGRKPNSPGEFGIVVRVRAGPDPDIASELGDSSLLYKLGSDVENYKWIQYQDMGPIEQQWGQALQSPWMPLKLKYISDRKAKAGDCPHFTAGFPVFSEAALTILKPVIGDETDLFDIEIQNGRRKFFLVNVTNILDCLDYDHSVIKRFDSGRIMDSRCGHFLVAGSRN